jgi:fructosamine-3-kinase
MTWKAELGLALGAVLSSADPVAGGDISDAYRVRLADRRVVFVKTHRHPPAGMFAAEARGLAWLRTGALRVPEVLAVGDAWLALEWLELGDHGAGFDEAFGRGLAQLHRAGAPGFGLDHDNFLATIAQDNRAAATWPDFWIDRRLRPLVELGLAKGRMPDVRALLDRLAPDRFGPPEPPARLHGDLWWGNVVAAHGAPIVIDPAVYGGHREVDLAMLALFGDLSDRLIAAYEEIWPLDEGWRQRRPLHKLVPLAAHAVLFGGGYGEQVRRVLTSLC